MSAQSLEKWLKAACDNAAQRWSVSLDLGHSRGPLNLASRRGADKTDFYFLNPQVFGHAPQGKEHVPCCHR